ncbi:MAG: NAD-binding protein [Nakamurella sp.]
MSNVLLVFWKQMFGDDDDEERPRIHWRARIGSGDQASATIFVIMRRMRAPLIILITIFAISVLGLVLIPGQYPDGQPFRMTFFDAFYFMSYTASTIGFGELPYPFNDNQRMWVTISIYLTVIGWAYAIGSLLTLIQDRAFRNALALQRFSRKVRRLREPFLLFAGYGQTGELLGKNFDALGQQFVVIDQSPDRIDSLDLVAYHADIPGLAGDVRNPHHLAVAGLDHPYCSGVLALTSDDEVNLAVTMAAALLRPELPVIARTVSPAIEDRMHAFGTPSVVNPFDRFGDHLRLALRAPASYQLLTWLESGPGAERPKRGRPPTHGRWVLCGYGRFGRELARDLRAEGLELTIIEPVARDGQDPSILVGDGSDPAVMAKVDLANAVGFVAGTDNDTTNLSLVAAARRINQNLFVAARQNLQASAPLFAAMKIDSLLVPTEVVVHEVYAQLSTPLLWRFLQEMPAKGDEWAAELLKEITENCGRNLQELWKIKLTQAEAPALQGWLAGGTALLGDLMRSSDDRETRLLAVPLLVQRGTESTLKPDDDFQLQPDDEILLAGRGSERRFLETTLFDDAVAQYVLYNRHVASSWIWRKLAKHPEPEVAAKQHAGQSGSAP